MNSGAPLRIQYEFGVNSGIFACKSKGFFSFNFIYAGAYVRIIWKTDRLGKSGYPRISQYKFSEMGYPRITWDKLGRLAYPGICKDKISELTYLGISKYKNPKLA
jgi:hypothetical protein